MHSIIEKAITDALKVLEKQAEFWKKIDKEYDELREYLNIQEAVKIIKHRHSTVISYSRHPLDKPTDNYDVYFIRAETGEIKIGVSSDVQRRLNELQLSSPVQLYLIHVIPNGGIKLEQEIHCELDEYRIHGEWFKIDDSTVLLNRELMKKVCLIRDRIGRVSVVGILNLVLDYYLHCVKKETEQR